MFYLSKDDLFLYDSQPINNNVVLNDYYWSFYIDLINYIIFYSYLKSIKISQKDMNKILYLLNYYYKLIFDKDLILEKFIFNGRFVKLNSLMYIGLPCFESGIVEEDKFYLSRDKLESYFYSEVEVKYIHYIIYITINNRIQREKLYSQSINNISGKEY